MKSAAGLAVVSRAGGLGGGNTPDLHGLILLEGRDSGRR